MLNLPSLYEPFKSCVPEDERCAAGTGAGRSRIDLPCWLLDMEIDATPMRVNAALDAEGGGVG